MRKPHLLLASATLLAVLPAAAVMAEDAPAPEEILRGAADFYQGQQRAKAAIATSLSESVRGAEPRTQSGVSTLAHARPDRLLLDLQSPFGASYFLADGKTVTVSRGGPSAPYATIDDSPDLVGIMTGEKYPEAIFFSSPEAHAAFLFTPRPAEAFLENAEAIEYEEFREGDDSLPALHVLRARLAEYDLLYSFGAGEPPLLHRIELDLRPALERSHAEGRLPHGMTPDDIQLESSIDFQWAFGEDVEEGLFVHEPSPDRPRAKTLAGAIGLTKESLPSAALTGSKVAEPIVLTRAGSGEEVTIGGANGDGSPVILNFWASWCGPCRMAMPHMDELAAALAEDGIPLYAVNFGETSAQVQEYIESNDYTSLQFLVDEEGRAAQAYRVTAVPQVNVLDGEGTVMSVYHGFAPFVADLLADEVAALDPAANPE